MRDRFSAWIHVDAAVLGALLLAAVPVLAARGESLAAFDGPFDSLALSLSKGELAQDVRGIPAGCVAPRSHAPGMLGRRALQAGRPARLGATTEHTGSM